MSWEDNKFPDADSADDVQWMIMYWRTVPCRSGCKGDYRLESRQFDHLPKGTTLKEARALLKKYTDQRRDSGVNKSRKNHVLFLCKVDMIERISDETGEIFNG